MKVLIALLALLMLPLASASAGEYQSIRELRQQTPARWTKSYETKWRDIEVDAEVFVPEVDHVPILRVCGGVKQPVPSAEEAGWDRVEARTPYHLVLMNDNPQYPLKVNGKRVDSPTALGNWYKGFAPENTYVPMDDTTFGEIVAMAEESLRRAGYDPADFLLHRPNHLWTHHIYEKGTKEDLLPGYMSMELRPLLAGIPVLGPIQEKVSFAQDSICVFSDANVGYDGYTGRLLHIFLSVFSVDEVLAEDVPLCPFDQVMQAVEKEINAGHVRKIYEIELGYVLYSDPDFHTDKKGRDRFDGACFFMKPAWQVNCLYVDSPSEKLRDSSSYTDDERNTLDYRQLIIDAQTGKLLTSKDGYLYSGFTPWKESR